MMKTVIFDIKNENGGIPIVGKNEKLESPKFESLADVGKSQANLETIDRCWTEPTEVGKFLLKFESFAAVGKFWLKLESLNFIESFQVQFKLSNFISHFPTSARAFQLQLELSNFNRSFPTSLGSFQFRLALPNFSETFQLKTFQLLILSNCPFQLHVSRK